MASQAVNLKSFVNYVVSLCTYFDGSALSSDNKTQLFDYLTEGVSNTSVAINVETGLAVLNKLNEQMRSSTKTVTVTNGSLSSLLSINSAKSLVDKAFATEDRSRFMTPAKVFNSTTLNYYNRIPWTIRMVAKSTFTNNVLTGTLYGGGGGGSGGVSGDGGKGSNFTVTSGAGANGGTSWISYEASNIATASGGKGGSSVSKTASGDVSISESGKAGESSTPVKVNLTVAKNANLSINPAYGGGGGGACTARYSGSKTYTGNSATTVVGVSGYAGDNSWSGEDYTFAGGGGEGGKGTGYSGMGYGSNSAGGAGAPTTYSATNQSNGVGGRGGYTSNTSQPAQPATMGAGGYGGTASYSNNVWDCSNGGNGGNAGGFVADASCSAYNTLFIHRGTLTL